ncbi:hypothetical protein EWB00_002965 [Schistosoma japonicum]|uniref:Uncharacterized protein n=1 Tax=Schistosoma japonicum TaxID=6182 RepID=A0A4Z2DA82_SCHJA|nr:hypothetical protein EWB00_002965 [Schistosoma japonicum]
MALTLQPQITSLLLTTTQHHHNISPTISTVDDDLSQSLAKPADENYEYYEIIINQSTQSTNRIGMELVDAQHLNINIGTLSHKCN